MLEKGMKKEKNLLIFLSFRVTSRLKLIAEKKLKG